MNRLSSFIEPITEADALPHDRAVWRTYGNVQHCGDPAPGTGGRKVSIERDDGVIFLSWGHMADWSRAKRWRFGWPPKT